MSNFTTPLIIEPIDERRWRLVEPFEYHVGSYPSNEVIVVPAGFITDFASVPRIFWPIFLPYGRYGKAAVVHDYCYRTGIYSRKRSDQIFLEAMTVLKVKPWRRYVLYFCVRLFSKPSWERYRKVNHVTKKN